MVLKGQKNCVSNLVIETLSMCKLGGSTCTCNIYVHFTFSDPVVRQEQQRLAQTVISPVPMQSSGTPSQQIVSPIPASPTSPLPNSTPA